MTVSPDVITGVHSADVCAMYPSLVISSPFSNYKTSMLPHPLKHKHTSLVCCQEITTCLYPVNVQPSLLWIHNRRSSLALLRVSTDGPLTLLRIPTDSPLHTLWFMGLTDNPSPHNRARHFSEVLLIIQQVVPYRTCGGTCCP
jgi:hypothetical protein